jgi:hypothetical protein
MRPSLISFWICPTRRTENAGDRPAILSLSGTIANFRCFEIIDSCSKFARFDDFSN